MQDTQLEGLGKGAWKHITTIHSTTGHHYNRLFDDWLNLMMLTFLSQTAQGAGNKTLYEHYEQHYLAIVEQYKDDKPQGERRIDLFAQAMAELIEEMTVTEQDVLGSLFMEHISSGENGQFFTPQAITQMMIQMLQPSDAESICDPACGSGRMLLEAHKYNPSANLHGTDIDERCAKICALNMFMFGCRATVIWGDTLTMEYWRCWDIGFVYMFERDPSSVVVQPKDEATHMIVPQKTTTQDQLGFDFTKKGEA